MTAAKLIEHLQAAMLKHKNEHPKEVELTVEFNEEAISLEIGYVELYAVITDEGIRYV